MNRPNAYTRTGAESFADATFNLYNALAAKYGDARAWEFLVKFYEGAGRSNE